jgi:tetratricopeptide (TPR) repeat protein
MAAGNKFKYLFLLLILITVFISYLVNINALIFHLYEFEQQLLNFQKNNKEMRHVNLIAKYKLHKDKYEEKIGYKVFFKREHELIELTDEILQSNDMSSSKYLKGALPNIIRYMNEFLRKLHGSKKTTVFDDMYIKELDIGYFLERKMYYIEAVSYYKKVLERDFVDDDIRSGVALHMGFCYALAGKVKKARRYYNQVILNYRNTDTAVIASILLNYLNGFNKKQKEIMSSSLSQGKRGLKLFELMAFKSALENLSQASEDTSIPPHQILFLKGKCYDQLGEKKKAARFEGKKENKG